jgi:Ca2+-transporting ATPase
VHAAAWWRIASAAKRSPRAFAASPALDCAATEEDEAVSVGDQTDVGRFPALSEAAAAERLRADGPNELPSRETRRFRELVREVLREPMILLLLACGGVYLLLGDTREAIVLLASVGVVIGITLYQNQKTERALEALREIASPRALVIRDGRERRIAGREVVRGDLVVVSEGDRVPADAVVLWSVSLTVDESVLTGEWVPVL